MPEKSSRKGPKGETETAAHYAGVLLEEIRDQVQLVAEAVQTTREDLKTQIDSVEQRLSGEIGDLKTGMRMLNQKIDGIGTHLDRHDEEIKDLRKVQNLS